MIDPEARPRRDEPPNNHVRLEVFKGIDGAAQRRLGQHRGRPLEGGGREPRLRLQRGLRDAQQHPLAHGQPLLLDAHPLDLPLAPRHRQRLDPRLERPLQQRAGDLVALPGQHLALPLPLRLRLRPLVSRFGSGLGPSLGLGLGPGGARDDEVLAQHLPDEGLPPAADLLVLLLEALQLLAELLQHHELVREEPGVAGVVDPHVVDHLADHQLDVLVVDVDALALVDLVDLRQEVVARLGHARDLEQQLRAGDALGEQVALADLVPGLDDRGVRERDAQLVVQLDLDQLRPLALDLAVTLALRPELLDGVDHARPVGGQVQREEGLAGLDRRAVLLEHREVLRQGEGPRHAGVGRPEHDHAVAPDDRQPRPLGLDRDRGRAGRERHPAGDLVAHLDLAAGAVGQAVLDAPPLRVLDDDHPPVLLQLDDRPVELGEHRLLVVGLAEGLPLLDPVARPHRGRDAGRQRVHAVLLAHDRHPAPRVPLEPVHDPADGALALDDRRRADLVAGLDGHQCLRDADALLVAADVDDLAPLLRAAHLRDHAADLGDLALGALQRLAGLEQLLGPRQPLGDVLADDAAGVERPHGELGPRLADALGRDHPHGRPQLHGPVGAEVEPVALHADPAAHLARRRRAHHDPRPHRDLFNLAPLELLGQVARDHLVLGDEHHVRLGIAHRLDAHGPDDALHEPLVARLDRPGEAPELPGPLAVDEPIALQEHLAVEDDGLGGVAPVDPLLERLHDVAAVVAQRVDLDALARAAVLRLDDQLLGGVVEPPRQIARLGRLEGRVGGALPPAVRADEVLEHRQPLAEVALDGRLEDAAGRVAHRAAHPGQLLHLVSAPAGLGGHDHVERVEGVLGQVGHGGLLHLVDGLHPDLDDRLPPFLGGGQPHLVLQLDLVHPPLRLLQNSRLLRRDEAVRHGDGEPRAGHDVERQVLELVQQLHGALQPEAVVALHHEAGDVAAVERLGVVPQLLRQQPVEAGAPQGGLDQLPIEADLHGGVQAEDPRLVRPLGLPQAAERLPRPLAVGVLQGEVVVREDEVLGGHGEGAAVRGREDVLAGEHPLARLLNGLREQRQVDGHLVAVEVGVVRRADERVDLDRLAVHQDGLERLDAQAVERRRAVEQHRVLLDQRLQDVPDLGQLAREGLVLDLVVVRDVVDLPLGQLPQDEGLEQLEGHLLGDAALVELQLGVHDDDGAARVVDALPQKVAPQPPLLPRDPLAQRLQGPVVPPQDRVVLLLVVDEGVDGLLQHPLLVAQNNFRRPHLPELLEAVVPVDDPPVEVVEVGGGELPALELDDGAQIGRDHRDDRQHHVLGAVARAAQLLHDLEALEQPLPPALARLGRDLGLQLLGPGFQVEVGQDALDPLGPRAHLEALRVELLVRFDLGLPEAVAHPERHLGVLDLSDEVDQAVDRLPGPLALQLGVDLLQEVILGLGDQLVGADGRERQELPRLHVGALLDLELRAGGDPVFVLPDAHQSHDLPVGQLALLELDLPGGLGPHLRRRRHEVRGLGLELLGPSQDLEL